MHLKFNTNWVHPTSSDGVFSSGDKVFTLGTTDTCAMGTFGKLEGKWYIEFVFGGTSGTDARVGLGPGFYPEGWIPGASTYHECYGYQASGYSVKSSAQTAYGNTWTYGDVIGIAWDADNRKIWYSINGTWQNSGDPASGANPAHSSVSSDLVLIPCAGMASGNGNTVTMYSEDDEFNYTPPTGFSAWDDASKSFLYTYKKNDPSASPDYYGASSCAGGSTFMNSCRFGYTGGSVYDGVIHLNGLDVDSTYILYSATMMLGISGLLYGSPTARVSLEKTLSASCVNSCSDINTAIANRTTDYIDIAPVSGVTWIYSTYEYFKVEGFVDVVSELVSQASWASGGELNVIVEDTTGTGNNYGDLEWNQHYPDSHILELEYKTGEPVTYNEAGIDGMGFTDTAAINFTIPAVGADTLGYGDAGDASPYMAVDSDTFGYGEFGDASHLSVNGYETFGFTDLGDAYVLKTSDTDSFGFTDLGDAYLLRVAASDLMSFRDLGDAASVRIFTVDDVYFHKRIRGGVLSLSGIFDGEGSGGLPMPAGSIHMGWTASGGLPIPVGSAEMIYERVLTATGYFPMPAGSVSSVIEVVATINSGLPIPVLDGTVARWEVVTVDGGLPIPAGVIEAAIEPGAIVVGSIPLPSGGRGALIQVGRRFAVLTYTRCS